MTQQPQNFSQFISKITQPSKFKRWLLALLVMILIMVAIFWIVPLEDVITALSAANPLYILYGYALTFPSLYLNAHQQKIMARKQGLNWKTWTIFRLDLTMQFYQLFVPGSIIGSSIRWYRFSQLENSPAETLSIIVYKRLLDIYLTIVLGLAFWFLANENITLKTILEFSAITFIIILLWVLLPKLSGHITPILNRIKERKPTNKLINKILNVLSKVFSSFSSYQDIHTKHQISLILAGIARNFLSLAAYVIFAKTLKINISWLELGWIRSAVILSAYLPINIGFGTSMRDLGLAAVLTALGTPATQAIALSILMLSRATFFALLGGCFEAIHLLKHQN